MRDSPQSRVDDLLSRQLSGNAIAGVRLKMRTFRFIFPSLF